MKNLLLITCIAFLAFMMNVTGAVHTINATDSLFSPGYISNVSVGDTIHWVRISGIHSTTSTMIPAGASGWESPLNSTVTTFDYIPLVAGTYHYKCVPHDSLGMTGSFTVIGLIATLCDTLDCNDSDACTTEFCDSISGCVYTPIVCNDSDLCTTDACVEGICEFDTIIDCNVGIREFPNSITLYIYPNPANDVLTVEAMDAPLTQIFITDIKGKRVYDSERLNGLQHHIQTSTLPQGIYLLHVQSNGGETIHQLNIER